MKAIVIGAGYGGIGIARALVLRNLPNVSVSIYERDSALDARFQGLTIGLQQSGADVLFKKLQFTQAISLFSEHGAKGLCLLGADSVEPMLESTRALSILVHDKRVSSLIDRSDLRNILLNQLQVENKSVDVNYNKRFVRYEESSTGVTAFFEDGTSVTGDILIGADGGNSVVRNQRCPQLFPSNLDYWTCAGVLGFQQEIDLSANKLNHLSARALVRKAGHEGASWLSFIDSSGGKTKLLWSISMPTVVASKYGVLSGNLSMLELRQKAASIASDLLVPESVDIISGTDDKAMFRGYNMTSVAEAVVKSNPMKNEPTSRVTLVGDAAHKTTTQAGLGATAALMDATSLAECIAKHASSGTPTNIAGALRTYEIEMSARAAKVVAQSVGNTIRIHETDPKKIKFGKYMLSVAGVIVRVIETGLRIIGK